MQNKISSFFLTERLENGARQFPAAPALVSAAGKSISYSELNLQTQALGEALCSEGLRPFDLVATSLPHALDSAVVSLALLRMGAVGVALEKRLVAAEIRRVQQAHPFRAVITHIANKKTFTEGRVPTKVIELKTWPNCELLILIFDVEKLKILEEKNVRWSLLTSGTTGAPKIVLLSEDNLRNRTLGEIDLFGLKTGDKILNCLTFAHDLGLNQLLTTIFCGATLSFIASLSPADLLRQFRTQAFSGMTGTPLVWKNLFKALGKEVLPLRQPPRYLTVSGGSLNPSELDQLRLIFPLTKIIRTYGQTETFRSLATEASEGYDLGFPLPGVELALLSDRRETVAQGEVGELFHRGQGEMTAYLQDDALTETKKTKRGIATGDFFSQDKEGRFYFIGRRDDMIKRRDHRFFLGELEQVLLTCEGVFQAVAINGFFPEGDEKLAAYVVLKDQLSMTEGEIRSFCQSKLSAYKIPDDIFIVKELPQTGSGKIDRQKLKQLFQESSHALTS